MSICDAWGSEAERERLHWLWSRVPPASSSSCYSERIIEMQICTVRLACDTTRMYCTSDDDDDSEISSSSSCLICMHMHRVHRKWMVAFILTTYRYKFGHKFIRLNSTMYGPATMVHCKQLFDSIELRLSEKFVEWLGGTWFVISRIEFPFSCLFPHWFQVTKRAPSPMQYRRPVWPTALPKHAVKDVWYRAAVIRISIVVIW